MKCRRLVLGPERNPTVQSTHKARASMYVCIIFVYSSLQWHEDVLVNSAFTK